ncbi:hypothetical protein OQA88_5735 [Cercophora sp. LCS_1]
MPSPRRIRLLFYVALATLVIMLFFTSHFRQTRDQDMRTAQDFYHKTMNAMGHGHRDGGRDGQKVVGAHDVEDDEVAKQMAARLKMAEQKAKDSANAKAPNKPDAPEDVIGVGSSASGQKKGSGDKEQSHETEEEHEVEAELNAILEKSPVIIFSKSYCPHSRRAKGILLDKYAIEPAPYVVELDIHPLGKKIQAELAKRTGRATVPNVMVYGVSIGGGDEMAALDASKKLGDKLKELGGKRIEVTERFVEDSAKKAG